MLLACSSLIWLEDAFINYASELTTPDIVPHCRTMKRDPLRTASRRQDATWAVFWMATLSRAAIWLLGLVAHHLVSAYDGSLALQLHQRYDKHPAI